MHRDSVGTAAVLHGGPGLPLVPGYIVTLHRTQLAQPIIPSYGIEVRVQTHQPCKDQRGNLVRHFSKVAYSFARLQLVEKINTAPYWGSKLILVIIPIDIIMSLVLPFNPLIH